MDPVGILAVRFIMAFLILAAVFCRKLVHLSRDSLHGGIILGILYTVCMILEMYGLRLVDTGVSALIENMVIVVVPLYTAVLTRTMPKAITMFCAILAVTGVGFLSISQTRGESGHLGMLLIILAAISYSFCIMATESVSRDSDPVAVGIIQLGVMGMLSLIISLFTGNLSLPENTRDWAMMLMLVLICSCFGFAFQPLGQKYLPAETAAVYTVINPLTASIMGILIAHEGMSVSKLIGYVLIFAALIIYNMKAAK